ncbi:hypothetical protein JAK41_01610 [Stenotrophomonas maltophilia]|uniref:hypothetical protein n=1 Tax=Stenotrophomonas maltophilia TaxID=40324 RepID=UPI0021CA003C|nr:hypothetical protein [Stenotrophomonas maltophilia]MCU1156870.1 hypothetical protein [Stenotrophomonas maltophilia]
MTLPNGTTTTQPLLADDLTWRKEVTFSIGDDAITSDWMAWSSLRLDTSRAGSELMKHPGMEGAWFQLWEKLPSERHRGGWQQLALEHQLRALPRSHEALQLELRGSKNPRALVACIEKASPQVISLPSSPVSVLVTTVRNLSDTVAPRVVVGGISPNAEAILEFLRAGRLGAVATMLDPGSKLAHQLLHKKVGDPIAATAAAYYLLRKRDWERLPARWLDNLADRFDYIPDAHLVRAASQIERGMEIGEAARLAVSTLSRVFDHGIPWFSEAAWLLGDLLAVAEESEEPLQPRTVRSLRRMLASARPAGVTFGFAGSAPDRPMRAQDAFELRQSTRGGALVTRALREMRSIPSPRPLALPAPQDLESASQQVRVSFNYLSSGLDMLLSSSTLAVPGSAAKTLFLRDVVGEGR